MKILKQLPPNYKALLKAFPTIDGKPYFYTYGDTLYNPLGVEIYPDALVHEEVHVKQYGEDPSTWEAMSDRYIKEPLFRFDCELEAYATQYNFVRQNYKRKVLDMFLDSISHDLAGEAYGNLCSFGEAQSKIKRLAKQIYETRKN